LQKKSWWIKNKGISGRFSIVSSPKTGVFFTEKGGSLNRLVCARRLTATEVPAGSVSKLKSWKGFTHQKIFGRIK
jgi:hypothetical protein